MKSFPVFVKTTGQAIVIAGGGEAAAQKARLMIRTDADLVIMSPILNKELLAIVSTGRARHIPLIADPETLRARLVIVATGCAAADAAIADLARRNGALVNVVDRPLLCDFTMPAIVDRDPVVVAIGTEGTAPVLARYIKSANEAMLEPQLGSFAVFAGDLRSRVAQAISPEKRRAFWEWFVGRIRTRFESADTDIAISEVNQVLDSGVVPGSEQSSITEIIADRSEADLMSLRALARLQRADLVVHGDAVGIGVLDLARRDAERVEVTRGSDAQSLADIIKKAGNAVILNDGQPPIGSLIHHLARKGASWETLSPAKDRLDDQRIKLAS